MPTISTFFGVSIRMYYDDHAPPHFHAYYGEHAAVILIDPADLDDGHLPKRALTLVLEWAAERQLELGDNWDRAVAHRPLLRVTPLE